MADNPAANDVYQRALALLASREHSRWELQQKLLSRYTGQQHLIDDVLARLERESYQSDERFVEAFVRMRQAKGIGAQRLRHELRTRGIENQLIERALEAPGAEKTLQILRVWQKKFATLPGDAEEKQRQVRFLLYRGFGREDVERLFMHLREDPLNPWSDGSDPPS